VKSELKKFVLLYVEDELDVQEIFSEFFSIYFKTVYTASNGNEALNLYNRYKPEVVILDINIPGIKGLELASMIRQKDKHVKIVMLTSYTDVELLLQAAEIDMSKYLVKPVDIAELEQTLDKIASELMQDDSQTIRFDEYTFYNVSKRVLVKNDKQIELSQKESNLLNLLIKNINKTVSIEDIMANVWEDSYDIEISKESVKSQVSKLRKKLPKDCINNVYGVGYILNI
jgi:DNA-binding response OmpR family regulator